MKNWGQHFLVDRYIAKRIAEYAELDRTDKVLEIGPGKGFLTAILSEQSYQVYAVEIDTKLAIFLKGRYPNVKVINGDALHIDLPDDYNKIVSNLPYHISTGIVYRILSRPFSLAILMFQRDFAMRMTAEPGTKLYGRLSLLTSFFCEASMLENVPKSAFQPAPQVISSIVKLIPKANRPNIEAARFVKFSQELFKSPRKKLKKRLASMGLNKDALEKMNPELLEKRPDELLPDQFGELAMNCFQID